MHVNFAIMSIKVGAAVLVMGGLLGLMLRPIRAFCMIVLTVSSWIVGFLLWLMCFGVVVDLWGMIAAIIGVLIAGVGCVPMAVIACVFHGSWNQVAFILVGLIDVFGSRLLVSHWDSAVRES